MKLILSTLFLLGTIVSLVFIPSNTYPLVVYLWLAAFVLSVTWFMSVVTHKVAGP